MKPIDISVSSNIIQQLKPALDALGPHQFKSAVKAASKRAATAASKDARKEIPTKWEVQKRVVGQKAVNLRESAGAFEIFSRGRRISSLQFSTKPSGNTDTTGNRRRPIYLRCFSGRPMVYIPNSWIWTRHGGLHLARRKKGKFGPLGGRFIEIKGPSVAQMLGSTPVREHVVDVMIETFEKRLRHEYEYRLQRAMEGKPK